MQSVPQDWTLGLVQGSCPTAQRKNTLERQEQSRCWEVYMKVQAVLEQYIWCRQLHCCSGEMCGQEAQSGEDLDGDTTVRSRHSWQDAALTGAVC